MVEMRQFKAILNPEGRLRLARLLLAVAHSGEAAKNRPAFLRKVLSIKNWQTFCLIYQ